MCINIADKLRIVGIAPIFRWMLPRNAAFYLHAVKLLIKHNIVQVFIVL